MEEWKGIPGYEGLYEASNEGRIRTVYGKQTSNARYAKRVWKQRILRPSHKTRRGSGKRDELVSLWKDGVCKKQLVARLVARAWCDGYSDGMTVNHIDGNPLNNSISNLEWISLADNIRHGYDTSLYRNAKPCTLVDPRGEAKVYRSMRDASLHLGRAESYVSYCLSRNRTIRSADGEIYDPAI